MGGNNRSLRKREPVLGDRKRDLAGRTEIVEDNLRLGQILIGCQFCREGDVAEIGGFGRVRSSEIFPCII